MVTIVHLQLIQLQGVITTAQLSVSKMKLIVVGMLNRGIITVPVMPIACPKFWMMDVLVFVTIWDLNVMLMK